MPRPVQSRSPNKATPQSVHPPPAFGSSPNLEALVLEASKPHAPVENNAVNHSEKFPSDFVGPCMKLHFQLVTSQNFSVRYFV
nr:serine/threonine-protein kinase STY46 isoform X2 [Ipomoea batatas]